MPLTMKSIKGYIYHQILLKKNTSNDKKKYTFWITYAKLACAINEHFKPEVLFDSKSFINNSIVDPSHLSFCYSLLQDKSFQNDVRSSVKSKLRHKHEENMGVYDFGMADYNEIHFD